jgi:hypothetical protein
MSGQTTNFMKKAAGKTIARIKPTNQKKKLSNTQLCTYSIRNEPSNLTEKTINPSKKKLNSVYHEKELPEE